MYMSIIGLLLCATLAFAQLSDSLPRTDTCGRASECIRAVTLNMNVTASNNFDAETEMLRALEAFANTHQDFATGCPEGMVRDYINKWKQVRQLQNERLTRMEQCIRRENYAGRGFEPCPMIDKNRLPSTCTTPVELWQRLRYAGFAGGAASSGNVDLFRRFPGRGGSRRIRRSTELDETSLAPFQPIAACLKDTCGCPEIEMCMKCYAIERFHRDIHILERDMLNIRWNCGLQMKS
jgi:hypothetical protein